MSALRWRRLRMNLWPPNMAAGVHVAHIAPDFRAITVELRPRWYSRGRHAGLAGGFLYAMADPFFALMVQHALGSGYLVWDKAGSIDVLAPARGRIWTRFELLDDDLQKIRRMTNDGDKHLHLFAVDLRDAEGMAIARVEKMVYVRKKRNAR
jgi:hypothetical protein